MIQVSAKALEQLQDLAAKYDRVGQPVRLKVIAGGCCGFCYDLDFDDQSSDADHRIDLDEFAIIVDEASHAFVKELTIDYISTPRTEGFAFQNPLAKEVCGCGTSFRV